MNKFLEILGTILKGYGTYLGLAVGVIGAIFGQAWADSFSQFGNALADFLAALADFLPELGVFLAAFGIGRKAGDKASKAGKI